MFGKSKKQKEEEEAQKLKEQSRVAANIVIDALMMAGIIKDEDADRVTEITEEEILVRKIMENL